MPSNEIVVGEEDGVEIIEYDVSIIVPVYVQYVHAIPWLTECLDSAVEQACEVVVWDDGSPIDLASIREEYKGYVRWYGGRPNQGVSYARNRAAELASRKFLFPLDCDDKLAGEYVIERMLKAYQGKPMYTDVKLLIDGAVSDYNLTDVTCENLDKHVGITAASVLHTREQWKEVGGWDERLDFYEDGEYNARLFVQYCSHHLKENLLVYRRHNRQRTVTYKGKEGAYARRVLDMIRRYTGMCCGSRRRNGGSPSNPVPAMRSNAMVMSSSNPQKVEYNDKELELPLSFEGKILAKYVGGQGKGKHTYRGPVSGAVHKRILFGNLVYVDPRDIRDPVNNTGPLKSLFIKVRKISSPDAPESSPTAKESEVPTDADEERTARVAPEREPVVDDVDEPEEEDDYEDEEYEYEPLPDIQNMSVNDIKQLDILPEEAEDLLEVEKQGKNRKSALRHLRKVAQS